MAARKPGLYQSPPGMAMRALILSPVSVPSDISQYWRSPRGDPRVGAIGPRTRRR
jgi:hypothetical protein